MKMTMPDVADLVLGVTRQTKTRLCEHTPRTDLQPMVHVVGENGQHGIAILDSREAIPLAVKAAAEEVGRLAFVGFTSDVYFRISTVEEERVRPTRSGDLRHRDASVVEALIVTVYDVASGGTFLLGQRYTWDGLGLPVFGEFEERGGQVDGDVADRVRSACPPPLPLLDAVRAVVARWPEEDQREVYVQLVRSDEYVPPLGAEVWQRLVDVTGGPREAHQAVAAIVRGQIGD